jgi:hypothetical protein
MEHMSHGALNNILEVLVLITVFFVGQAEDS